MSNSSPKSPPLHYLIPLFPCYQLLDLAGPLDILNLLSLQVEAKDITLTFIASTLDPVPTKPIPPPDKKWTFEIQPQYPAIDGKVNTAFNQYIIPDTTFDAYLAALKSQQADPSATSSDSKQQLKPVDVLLIPGGVGTRINRIYPASSPDAEATTTSNIADILTFIPQIAPYIRHSIVTVCTGSDLLAQTGLLNHRRATTNMAAFGRVAARSPQVNWLPKRRWVRSQPSELESSVSSPAKEIQIWTSAGISAGIDVMLAFVQENYGGLEVARMAARRLEYEWREVPEGEVDSLYAYLDD